MLVYVNPETDAVIDVDNQLTFMFGHEWDGVTYAPGGLPVRDGHLIIPKVKKVHKFFPTERRYATIDRHRRGSVSLASSIVGATPYSVLTLAEVRTWTATSHRIAPHARFTLDQLRWYLEELERKEFQRSGNAGGGIQVLWPDHGLEDTIEGEMHPAFSHDLYAYVQVKGLDDCCDSYSGLLDNLGRPVGLGERMQKDGVERVFGTGLTEDFCVKWTLLNAKRDYKFREVFMIIDATRPVDVPGNERVAGSVAKSIHEMVKAGIQFVTTDQLRLVTNPAA